MNSNPKALKWIFSPSHITAGFIAVLVGYSSSAVLVFQAAKAAGASPAEISSWLWALGLGMGVSSIGLSLYYKTPLLTAWSTPGAALLTGSLVGLSLAESVGVFIFSSFLIMVCGYSGYFERLMHKIPLPLAGAMLAGILLSFGIELFKGLESNVVLVGAMLLAYVCIKPLWPRYCLLGVLLVGLSIALLQGELDGQLLELKIASPIWTAPEFNLQSMLGVGIPLFVITMASQNIPGVAVLRAHGYQAPVSAAVGGTGLLGVLMAPFGGFAYNLAAITAAICMSKDAGADPKQRYMASVWGGCFYALAGIFAASIASLFAAFPEALIIAVAGLALLPTIANSLALAVNEEGSREAALVTFLLCLSGLDFLGVHSAFWGLVAGILVHAIQSLNSNIKVT